MAHIKTRVAVIGGGPGGYAAAFRAADLGLDVTLIDDAPNPGGTCLYRGCIPSKALLHVAKVLTDAREAEAFGVRFGPPAIDREQVSTWKEGVVQRLTQGLGSLTKQRGIRYVQGRARLQSGTRATVAEAGGGELEVEFEYAILATGSVPAALPGLPTGSPRVMDSTAALKLEEIPRSLLVVGGGYIGLELATVYNALGAEVTVVEAADRLLPAADRDLVRVLEARLKRTLAGIMLKTEVAEVRDEGDQVRVAFRGEGASVEEGLFDRVLVAVGRRPNSSALGLENTRVEVSERGFIQVNSERRTAEPTLFAVGDVAGEPMLAHKAAHEGRTAAEVIAGKRVAFAPAAIPAVVFTDPEIAWCGVTETEAKSDGRDITVVRFPWGASGRALTLGRAEGVTKLVVDRETDRVIGVGIAGPGAGELIAEGVLAVEMGASPMDVQLTIHPHPTLSETIMEAAESVYGSSTHMFRRSR